MRPRIQNIRHTLHTGIDNQARFHHAPIKTIVFDGATPRHVTVEIPSDANQSERACEALRNFNPAVEALGFYFLRNAIVRGRGFALVDEHLLDAESLIPSYVRQSIDTGQQTDAEPQPARRQRTVSDSVAVIVGDAHLVYGHWLIDILPRAWLLKTALGEPIPYLKIALPADTPKYALELLAILFDFTSIDYLFFDIQSEELVTSELIIPSLLHKDHAFHPAMNLFVSYVCAKLALDPKQAAAADLIYVSRRKFRGATTSYRRSISNEDEVINLMRQHGFMIVHPEELLWVDQVRLFSRAKIVAGESGSALHNTIFSNENTVVLCIRPVNQVQATIAALRNQIVYFFYPENECVTDTEIQFSIDVTRLDASLLRCKAIANAHSL